MRQMLFGLLTAGLAVAGLGATQAEAAFITGYGYPSANSAFSGGATVTFENVAATTYSSLTVGDVTFSTTGSERLYVGGDFSGQFNTYGKSLYNTYNADAFSVLNITLASPTSGIAFNWGAADTVWSLQVYDIYNNLLEAYSLEATKFDNDKKFFGVTNSAGIASVKLVQAGHGDYVFIDNFTYGTSVTGGGGGGDAVPEPMTVTLVGASLAGFGLMRRRRTA